MNEVTRVSSAQSTSKQSIDRDIREERGQEGSEGQRRQDESTFARLAISELQRDLQRVDDQARQAQQDAQGSRQLAQNARGAALQAQKTLLANCRDRWLGVSSGVWQARLS
jgi:molecular chaperone GrpE (heat shock protein)